MIDEHFLYQINISIEKAAAFLATQQSTSGVFDSIISINENLEEIDEYGIQKWADKDPHSLFPTLLIGGAILNIKNDNVANILKNIVHLLMEQKRYKFLWNHFLPKHILYKVCPFDVDDTACASIIMEKMGVEVQANIPAILSNVNRNGLFYTWFTFRGVRNTNVTSWVNSLRILPYPIHNIMFWRKMECEPNDIDGVVNANVLYYLGDIPETQAVIQYIIDIILNNQEDNCDKWYLNKFTIYYFFSRIYKKGINKLEPITIPIRDRILKNKNENASIGNSILDTALGIIALLNIGFEAPLLSASIDFLLENQHPNGGWDKRIFYYGGPKKLIGWGSEALTTAMCMEALDLYNNTNTNL